MLSSSISFKNYIDHSVWIPPIVVIARFLGQRVKTYSFTSPLISTLILTIVILLSSWFPIIRQQVISTARLDGRWSAISLVFHGFDQLLPQWSTRLLERGQRSWTALLHHDGMLGPVGLPKSHAKDLKRSKNVLTNLEIKNLYQKYIIKRRKVVCPEHETEWNCAPWRSHAHSLQTSFFSLGAPQGPPRNVKADGCWTVFPFQMVTETVWNRQQSNCLPFAMSATSKKPNNSHVPS